MPVMFLPQKCFPLKSNRKVSPHADTKLTCGLLLKEKTLPSLERVAIERAACTEPGVRGKSPDTSLNSSDMDGQLTGRTQCLYRIDVANWLPQETGNRSVVDCPDNRLRDNHILQGTAIPAHHLQSIGFRCSAGDAFNQHSIKRGKKRAVARCGADHRSLRHHTAGNVAAAPISWSGLSLTKHDPANSPPPDRVLRRRGHGRPHVESDYRRSAHEHRRVIN